MSSSRRKKRKRRNRIIIISAVLAIIFCIAVMRGIAIETNNQPLSFLLFEIPVGLAIVMIFFIAKDRIQ